MVKFLHFKTMALLLLMIVGASSAWAETVTFTAGTDKSEGTSITKSGITISFSSGVFNRDDNYRCYSGASMTISSTVGNITQIDFTATSSNPMTKFSGNPDVGAWTDASTKTQWTGNASEINFGTTSGQARITAIVVTYTTSGGSGGDTPTKTVTTTTISATGITNTDVYTSTTAGTLSASVKAGENTVSGATVTWSSSNPSVATVDANGAVTLVAAGTTTITASYAGDATYEASSDTYELTVTSSAPVVDYATLPFEYKNGRSGIESTPGLTQDGLGSDYSSSAKMKFDGTGDYLVLKINEIPGKLSYDIQGNGFSGGTFKVQVSENGQDYSDLKTYTTISSTVTTEEFDPATNVRYIKWIYTNKSSGNVGVGNISLALPSSNAGAATFVKVTDASTLRAGDQFILVYETGSLALGAINSGGKYYESASVTISDNTVSNPSGVAVLTLGGEEDAWTINSSLSGHYLSLTGSSNELKAATSVSNNNTENWTISIGEFVKIINNAYPKNNSADRYIQWNNTSGNQRFACYGGTQQNLQLYRLSKSVTVTSAGYATYCSDAAMNFDGVGIKAYTATDNGSSVRLTEITSGHVPANTPVVLYKDGGATANVPVIASADAVGSNDLRVSTGENPTNAYVLAKPSGQPVGFYLWDSSATLNAGKVYLQANSSTGNARQFLPFGETTAIENVNVSKTLNGEVFDLQGRRVAQPQKGLYIVNGRKVVVK